MSRSKIPDISLLTIEEGKTISLLSGEIIDNKICNPKYMSKSSKKRKREEIVDGWEENFVKDFYLGNLNFENYKDEMISVDNLQNKSCFFFMDDEITFFIIEKILQEVTVASANNIYSRMENLINFLIKNISFYKCRNSLKKLLTFIDENGLYCCFSNYVDCEIWYDFFTRSDWKLCSLFLSYKAGSIIFSIISPKLSYIALKNNNQTFLNKRYEINKYLSQHKKCPFLQKDFFSFAVAYENSSERNISNFKKIVKSYLPYLNIIESTNPIFQEIYKIISHSPDNFEVIINFILKIDKYDERKISFNIYKNNSLWINDVEYPKQITTSKQTKIINKIVLKLCKNSNPFY